MVHAKLAKVMEICYQSWNFTNFAPKLYEICMFFGTTKKLSIYEDSLHFRMFSKKCSKCKNREEGGSW